jgi:AcrR family transcriptional regulator
MYYSRTVYDSNTVYDKQLVNGPRPGERMVDEDEEDLFVPLRPLAGGSVRDRRERRRERQIAHRVSRQRDHGARPGRRPRGIQVDEIVGAAVAVADAEGTEAVSMRRIARDLDVGTMSLYWYVSSKEELHQLMLEQVQAEVEAPAPSGDWQADLRGYARAMRAALRRHPWAIDYIGVGPPSGPNDARNADRLIGALDGLGLDMDCATRLLMTFNTYVMGAALREIQEIRWQHTAAELTADVTEGEIAEFLTELGRRIRESGRYPRLTRLLDSGVDPDSPKTRDERFEFGLDCVLDGIAVRVRGLGQPPPPSPS